MNKYFFYVQIVNSKPYIVVITATTDVTATVTIAAQSTYYQVFKQQLQSHDKQ